MVIIIATVDIKCRFCLQIKISLASFGTFGNLDWKKSLLMHSGIVEERYLIYFSIGHPYLIFHFGARTVSKCTISYPEDKDIVGKLYTQRI